MTTMTTQIKDNTKRKHFLFSIPIGQRMIRSAIGVLCCVLVYYIRGGGGNPFYSSLAVLQCIQPYNESTKAMAIQRSTGTLVGAFFGFITLLIQVYLIGGNYRYLIVPLMIIPVIYTTLLIKKKNASYFSCVVYLSITIVHIGDANPFMFVVQRVTDTFIGIFLAIIINSVHMPRKKLSDTLIIARLDDALDSHKENLTPYSKFELNRIIDDGAKLTLATMRTPASLMEPMNGVKLSIPIIVMDGAALYDIGTNSFLQAYVLSEQTVSALCDSAKKRNLSVFVNSLADNTLLIFYEQLNNDAQKDIYKKLSKSPYRNYINRTYNPEDKVIYLMCIDKTDIIKEYYDYLEKSPYGQKLKILCYPSNDYPGYSYIKIYNKNAQPKNMIQYLMEEQKLEKRLIIGTDNSCDIKIKETDLNSIAKALKNTFEPIKKIH